eukprot:gene4411-14536_t
MGCLYSQVGVRPRISTQLADPLHGTLCQTRCCSTGLGSVDQQIYRAPYAKLAAAAQALGQRISRSSGPTSQFEVNTSTRLEGSTGEPQQLGQLGWAQWASQI